MADNWGGGEQDEKTDYETDFETEALKDDEIANTCGGGDESANNSRKVKVEIEIDPNFYILDEDIDFNELYH